MADPQQPDVPEAVEGTVTATIMITMTSDGKINVNGPLENKLLMLGLLEIAKDTTLKYNDQIQKRIVQAPFGIDPRRLKG